MPAPGLDVDPLRAPNRVDRPVAGRDRPEPRLLRAKPELEAPVGALAVRPVGGLVRRSPGDVADRRIGEAADELPQRVALPERIRIGEGDDLPARLPDTPVLRRDLASALAADELDARVLGGEPLDDLVRPVGRSVGGDDDLDQLTRVVEVEQVPNAPLDHVALVVCRDDDAHRGLDLAGIDPPAAHARGQSRCQRVAHVRPDERGEREPEQDLGDEHRAELRAASS